MGHPRDLTTVVLTQLLVGVSPWHWTLRLLLNIYNDRFPEAVFIFKYLSSFEK
jgi:hypothetical protein